MKKSDGREWRYIKPLIKSDYNLKVKVPSDLDCELYEHVLDNFHVQSIKVDKQGTLEITIKPTKKWLEVNG